MEQEYYFKCPCRAELTAHGPADEVMKVYESWDQRHSHAARIPADKAAEAIQAQEYLNEGKSLRETAVLLGYAHPESIKYLLRRYTPEPVTPPNLTENENE